MKVLVADDDAIVRTLIVKAVESLGHVTIQAADGKQAWNILCNNQDIALLITDIMMPDMSGESLVKIIRGNEGTSSLPVIIVSGIVSIGEIEGILQLGNSCFIAK
ncbi:MAG: response regulator, partial [Candidatus Dadabacteria bacterium]